MSGLARMLVDAGAIVTGSDRSLNDQTERLSSPRVVIDGNQDGHLVTAEVDLVVRTAAVPDNNLEFMSARKRGIETIKYAELLGQVMAERPRHRRRRHARQEHDHRDDRVRAA
jgi:UDP-N-acetylmuramate--alanine ligase